jgi:glycosyltransferase involved in cell wall biosynthesis
VLSTLQTAGAETTSVAVVARLRLAGVDARLATMREDRDGLPAATARELVLPRHHLGARRIISLRGLIRLSRLARQHRPAVLHAEDRDAALLCGAAARLTGTPFVVTRHVLDEPSGGRGARIKRALLSRTLRRANLVIAVSEAVARRVRSDDGVNADRVQAIYNSLDPELFPTVVPNEARRQLGWPERPTVTLVGALRPGKGHEVALEAARIVRLRWPELRVLFVGDGPLRDQLESIANGDAEFVGNRSDIPLVLSASDVVILPSDAEALPTVLIEAACASRPVVASRVGGVPEIVDDGDTGLIIEPQNPQALARAIEDLLDDPERSAQMGQTARRRAIERFSPARQVEELLAVYRSVSP